MDASLFGKKIAALRKQKGLTQAKLAEQLHVSNKAISRWETGEGYPEISILKPLATALGTTVDELLSDEDSTEKNNEPTMSEDEQKNKTYTEQLVTWSALLKFDYRTFWESLIVWNKLTCIFLCGAFLTVLYWIGKIIFHLETSNTEILTYLFCKAGFFSSLIGLLLGILKCGKRQTKDSILLIAFCYCFGYISLMMPHWLLTLLW